MLILSLVEARPREKPMRVEKAATAKLAKISWAVLASENDYQPLHKAAGFFN